MHSNLFLIIRIIKLKHIGINKVTLEQVVSNLIVINKANKIFMFI